ncbi:MAG TPA: MlaD family protein [Baekduia sp.]|nr:MlaD family protein [Baekduia sp.]
MAPRIVVAALVVAAVLTTALLAASGGDDDRYAFRAELDNALGLREGSLVTAGGVEIGKVDVDLGRGDRVVVTGRLDEGQGPIGRDARASITSVNLLGQKRLELVKGSAATRPAPSGSTIPSSRITASTDLDEVLAVLAPDVRARLRVLLNEAGAAVVGRGADIGRLLDTLPPTVAKATAVVDRVAADTATLERLLVRSDEVVGDLAAERRSVSRVVDRAGQAAASFAGRRAELRRTLQGAPGALGSLQRFLAQLERAAVPLGPAARDIRASAPELLRTVDELEPFRAAVTPVLQTAQRTAPQLTRLADGALPVLRRATPSARRLAGFASELVPVTDTLDKSVHNLIGTVDNWSRAVQYRDGLSHIFRGEAGMTPQTLEGVMGRYLRLLGKDRKRRTALRPRPAAGPAPRAGRPAVRFPQVRAPRPGIPKVDETVDRTLDGVGQTVQGLVGGVAGGGRSGDASEPLLDFLLKP